MEPPTHPTAPPIPPNPNEDSLIRLPQEAPHPPPNAARATETASKDKRILFGTVVAALKFIREKIRAVKDAQHRISVAWFEVEDYVYATAADPVNELEQVTVIETETIDDFQNHLRILKVSRANQFKNVILPQPTVFDFRPVTESMEMSAEQWMARLWSKRKRPKGTPRSKDVKIKVDGGAKKVSDWSWNNDTVEESWERLGIEQHHAKISWAEQCYMEKCRQEDPKTMHGCYQQSLLRWSLTIGDQ